MDDEHPMDESGSDTRTSYLDPETGEILDAPPELSNVIAFDPQAGLPSQCTAKNRSGNQCGRAPIVGGTVCHYHGGAAPQVQSKAIERLAHARDLALDRFIEFVADDGDIIDPKILLDAATRLTDKVELLQGRATQRTETDDRAHYESVKLDLLERLDELARRNYRGIARTGTDNAEPPESLPGGPDMEIIDIDPPGEDPA